MAGHFDELETRDHQARERDLFDRLPEFLERAIASAPGLARWLDGIDPASVSSRAALSKLPVLRKSDLMEFQADDPPFGGFADPAALARREGFPVARPALGAAGSGHRSLAGGAGLLRRRDPRRRHRPQRLRPSHDARRLHPRRRRPRAGLHGLSGRHRQHRHAGRGRGSLKPDVYCGTPDFLKVMLDRAAEMGKDLSSFRRALVSGGALFPSLRAEYFSRGVRSPAVLRDGRVRRHRL